MIYGLSRGIGFFQTFEMWNKNLEQSSFVSAFFSIALLSYGRQTNSFLFGMFGVEAGRCESTIFTMELGQILTIFGIGMQIGSIGFRRMK